MNLPLRYILINNENIVPYIIQLRTVPYLNILNLQLSFHTFNGKLSSSIIESFSSNDSNEYYFNSLPLTTVIKHDLNLNQCESFVISLQRLMSKNLNTEGFINLKYYKFDLFLTYDQLFKINNFIDDFVKNYYYYKTEYYNSLEGTKNDKIIAVNQENSNSNSNNNTLVNDSSSNISNIQEPKEEELENKIIKNKDNLQLYLEESLKLCSNNILNYQIYKYIDNLVKNDQILEDDFQMIVKDDIVYINIKPLIDIKLFSISDKHYENLQLIFNSINYTGDEYLGILKKVCNYLIFIVINYLNNNLLKSEIVIPLKIIDFIIYVIAAKYSNISSLTKTNMMNFFESYQNLINQCLNFLFMNFIDTNKFNFKSIYLYHSLNEKYENDENLINKEKLLAIIEKNKYMATLDSTSFIKNCFKDLEDLKKINNKIENKLIINNPKIINIDELIRNNLDNLSNNMLSYNLIQSGNPNITSKRIITKDYFHLLLMVLSPGTITIIQKEINPLLLRYATIIKDNIFSKLMKIEKIKIVDTLDLLQNYIKPFLINEDIAVSTELYILYRTVIPYLYDINEINEFKDYFH
jgi:hypothetical protein